MKNNNKRTDETLQNFEDLISNTVDYLEDDFPNGYSDDVLLTSLVETVQSNDDIYPNGHETDEMVRDAFYEILNLDGKTDNFQRFDQVFEKISDSLKEED